MRALGYPRSYKSIELQSRLHGYEVICEVPMVKAALTARVIKIWVVLSFQCVFVIDRTTLKTSNWAYVTSWCLVVAWVNVCIVETFLFQTNIVENLYHCLRMSRLVAFFFLGNYPFIPFMVSLALFWSFLYLRAPETKGVSTIDITSQFRTTRIIINLSAEKRAQYEQYRSVELEDKLPHSMLCSNRGADRAVFT